jgi:hypothetical protein
MNLQQIRNITLTLLCRLYGIKIELSSGAGASIIWWKYTELVEKFPNNINNNILCAHELSLQEK